MTSRGVRAECSRTTSASASRAPQRAQHAHDRRDPAARADEQQLARGTRAGSTNSPSTPPRRTIDPAAPGGPDSGDTSPASTSFGVMLIHPSRRPGRRSANTPASGGPRSPRPDPQILPRLVARPLPARTDHTPSPRPRSPAGCARSGRAAPARPERIDQLQIVIGQQRREERPHQSAAAAAATPAPADAPRAQPRRTPDHCFRGVSDASPRDRAPPTARVSTGLLTIAASVAPASRATNRQPVDTPDAAPVRCAHGLTRSAESGVELDAAGLNVEGFVAPAAVAAEHPFEHGGPHVQLHFLGHSEAVVHDVGQPVAGP